MTGGPVTININNKDAMFLNQPCAWFLKVDPVRIISMCVCLCVFVCVCVSPPPRLLITSGVMWR